jgi:hypothetical protein
VVPPNLAKKPTHFDITDKTGNAYYQFSTLLQRELSITQYQQCSQSMAPPPCRIGCNVLYSFIAFSIYFWDIISFLFYLINLCLWDSYRHMDAATDTFKDSAMPSIGILNEPSTYISSNLLTPLDSFPKIKAIFLEISQS